MHGFKVRDSDSESSLVFCDLLSSVCCSAKGFGPGLGGLAESSAHADPGTRVARPAPALELSEES